MIATKFHRLYPCFRDRATRLDYCGDCPTCGFVRIPRWRPITGSRYDITLISAGIHNCNAIPTATPMFLGSGDTTIDYRGDCLIVWIC